MKKAIWLVIAGLLIAALVWVLYPTEQRKLKSEIGSLRRAVERESTDEVIKRIDPAYEDAHGLTHAGLVPVIEQFFAGVDSINVQMSGLKVTIDSVGRDKTIFASCSLGVRLLARFEGERVLAFGGIVRPGTVRAWFHKTGPEYLIYRAEY
ncbi:hypothetical protein IBX73_09830 [candidate division WOR-3 bacterium]|nr:hypothetical protein [candidate division WOR-3 bacterium]